MEQYLDTLKFIKEKGTYKPAARENMPGTQSLFGHQFRHDLSTGFPLLTTKKMFWKGVVTELLWFLRGDTNIKYLVDNGCNIWNEDAYQYYVKLYKNTGLPILDITPMDTFISKIKEGILSYENERVPNYVLGDCGFQYGRVWRGWEKVINDEQPPEFDNKIYSIDQIKNVINSLKKNPESRRHIVTAIDPAHENDLALYWCHAMFQFNCRPLTLNDKANYLRDKGIGADYSENIPKYYLDCQLYQRSADVFLGVPFNIASYALLTHILAKICNMIPGEFIHTFGDVHIYDNHKDAVEQQLQRIPTELPTLKIKDEGNDWAAIGNLNFDLIEVLGVDDFIIENYNPQPPIKAELSTGLKK